MTYGEAFLDFLKKIEIEDRDDFFDLFDHADSNGLLYDELSGKQTNFVDPEDYDGREEIDENNPDFNPDFGKYAVHCNGFETLACRHTLCINCEYRNFWRREFKESEEENG